MSVALDQSKWSTSLCTAPQTWNGTILPRLAASPHRALRPFPHSLPTSMCSFF